MLDLRVSTAFYDTGRLIEINVRGELDFTQVARLRELWDQILRQQPVGVVLDLSGVSVIDSAAAQEVLWCHTHLWLNSCRLQVVVGDNTAVQQLLSEFRWGGILHLHGTRADARAELLQSGPDAPSDSSPQL